ncbi:MAG: hypothetical protein IBJ19_18855 [Gemmatimonadaceae bacterium]|nr:hypothetical protein [Gemmatimonadaceae bacterium]
MGARVRSFSPSAPAPAAPSAARRAATAPASSRPAKRGAGKPVPARSAAPARGGQAAAEKSDDVFPVSAAALIPFDEDGDSDGILESF